jgi:hypothetical protein
MAKRGAGLRLLATYWPYREASHRPPTGQKGTALGGRPSHRPSLAIREAPARLATYWPKGTGRGRLRPALPRLATYAPTPHTSR